MSVRTVVAFSLRALCTLPSTAPPWIPSRSFTPEPSYQVEPCFWEALFQSVCDGCDLLSNCFGCLEQILYAILRVMSEDMSWTKCILSLNMLNLFSFFIYANILTCINCLFYIYSIFSLSFSSISTGLSPLPFRPVVWTDVDTGDVLLVPGQQLPEFCHHTSNCHSSKCSISWQIIDHFKTIWTNKIKTESFHIVLY